MEYKQNETQYLISFVLFALSVFSTFSVTTLKITKITNMSQIKFAVVRTHYVTINLSNEHIIYRIIFFLEYISKFKILTFLLFSYYIPRYCQVL